jgi:hypothetical protein
MRNRETIKLDSKEITIKELTVKQIMMLGDKIANSSKSAGEGESDFDLIKGAFKDHLELGVEGIIFEELIELAPSELKLIYEKFKEVNAVFFEVAQQIGLLDLLQRIKLELQNGFLKSLAD